MLLSKMDIAQFVPHSGNMVLLDAVLACDATSIHCLAVSHHAADHPLRENGRLPAWCGIEYAAQAMAVHHRMNLPSGGEARPAPGVLAVARDVLVLQPDLDGEPGDLHVYAEKIVVAGDTLLYQFRLEGAGNIILSGRATVVIQGGQA